MLTIEEYADKKSITHNEAWRLVTRGQLKVIEKNGTVFIADRYILGGSKKINSTEKFKSKFQMQQEVEDLQILVSTLEKELSQK